MDFTNLYTTRIQKNFDDDQAEILKAFHDKVVSKEVVKVTLINYHKGLPIMYPATVVAVERGTLDLDVHPQQAVAIDGDRYTLIRSNLFPYAIAAHVQYVNVKKHAVTLNKLCYVEILAEKRNAVRLNLDPPVDASIIHDGMEIVGKLLDISVQGVAMNLDHYLQIEAGTDVTIQFMLPDLALQKQVQMKLAATLVNIDGQASPYRCRFKVSPDKQQEQLISRYVFQRQVEVIHGLKDVVD
ncbi:MAG: PilZ domain-containing protein [Geobacteraceae bacterium]|nr:PilZ domain-containing protein [Geobacteraceae bacterium]